MFNRAGGRGAEEFRPAFIKTKVLSQAAGSAYAEFEDSKVMVGVYGPRQATDRRQAFSDTGRLACDVKLTSFAALKQKKAQQVRGKPPGGAARAFCSPVTTWRSAVAAALLATVCASPATP